MPSLCWMHLCEQHLSKLCCNSRNRSNTWYLKRLASWRMHGVQYIPRNMHTVFALWFYIFFVVIHWLISPYPSGLLHCPSASKATLMNMDKYFMWIHYKRLHNHNKAKHNKTVCIFLGIYCICVNEAGHHFINKDVFSYKCAVVWLGQFLFWHQKDMQLTIVCE